MWGTCRANYNAICQIKPNMLKTFIENKRADISTFTSWCWWLKITCRLTYRDMSGIFKTMKIILYICVCVCVYLSVSISKSRVNVYVGMGCGQAWVALRVNHILCWYFPYQTQLKFESPKTNLLSLFEPVTTKLFTMKFYSVIEQMRDHWINGLEIFKSQETELGCGDHDERCQLSMG